MCAKFANACNLGLNLIICIHKRAPHSFLYSAALTCRLHRHPSAAQGQLTPSIQSNLGLPQTRHQSTHIRHQHPSSHTVLIHSLHVPKPSQYLRICSTCQLSFYTPALLRTSSFQLYQFVSLQPNFSDTSSQKDLLSFSQDFSYSMPPCNAVDTITPSYRHCFAFIPNNLMFITFFSTSHALYPSFILCTTSVSQPPSAATCDPRYLIHCRCIHLMHFFL